MQYNFNATNKNIVYVACMCAKVPQSCLTLCDPWTVALQAPLSMGFSRQEYWSGLPCSPPGALPDPGIEPPSFMSPALPGSLYQQRRLGGHSICYCLKMGLPGGSEGKASACSAEDLGSIPGLGRSPGEGNGNPLQYSCLENSMDCGAWQATVHGVTKSRTERLHFIILKQAHLERVFL